MKIYLIIFYFLFFSFSFLIGQDEIQIEELTKKGTIYLKKEDYQLQILLH